ncbi:scavenger receptor cysteine-rich domain-containing group B protein [Brachionichthys hirsutus]|uniref:scavenger receptor cysteine-rich domain-containing group B protein n=1 Tax=Brachionichthys hirsutus TaxID=412623 RepID=UPI0036051D94
MRLQGPTVCQVAMRGQRVAESECRCWSLAVWVLVSLLGTLVLVAFSVVLRLGDIKIGRRALYAESLQTTERIQFKVILVNGRNRCEGRLEVLDNSSQGTVCDDHWDMVDANVVCRQLDCGVAIHTSSYFGHGSGPILLDNVDCAGHEISLDQCNSLGWGIHNCYHYEDVGITCKDAIVKTQEDPTTQPMQVSTLRVGTIRLVNGRTACQGRVEIFHRGTWGTVCDDDWNYDNAKVVCQQLGCGRAIFAHTNSYYGHGTGMVLLDNVHCYGFESDLIECRSLGWGNHNCGHHEDAGVTCSGPVTVPPVETQDPIRLWNTVNTQATDGTPVTTPQSTTTVTTTTTTTTTKATPSIRLMLGDNESCSGRVEIFYNNVWGTVCDDGWDMENANVVCKQLGCGRAKSAVTHAFFGYGPGPILLDNVACIGTENQLTGCFHLGLGEHNCGHHEDAGVICEVPVLEAQNGRSFKGTERITATATPTPTPTTEPPEGTVRLVNGQHRCEGRMEIYFEVTGWGTVCDDEWDMTDAYVVCHQVGCGEALAAKKEAFFHRGTGKILIANLKCTGFEDSLLDCSHIPWNVHNCDHSEDAGVTCSLL